MTLLLEQPRAAQDARDAELASLAKALAHPARVRILRLLVAGDTCFYGELGERLPLAQANVSQHLKVLKDADLVAGKVDPPRTCYHANLNRLEALHDLVDDLVAGRNGS